MAHPLELSYRWQTPVLFASVGAAVCVGTVARSEAADRAAVAGSILVLWLLFVTLVWLRTRAYLMVDGDRLTVRRWRRRHVVSAERLVAVRQFPTPHGPSYKLTVRDDHGRTHTRVAPVALLRSGHATLFQWVLTRVPAVELDRGSRRTLDQLRATGLVR